MAGEAVLEVQSGVDLTNLPRIQVVSQISVSQLDGNNGFLLRSDVALNPTDGEEEDEEIGGGGSGDPDLFGASVAFAGDLNGDGFDDLVVGAPYANLWVTYGSRWTYVDGPNAGTGGSDYSVELEERAGAAYIVYGSEAGFAAQTEVHSLAPGDGFVLKGDGLAEVYDGQYTFEVPDPDNPGSTISVTSASWSIDTHAIGRLGHSVSTAGDINGDGIADLIVGAPSSGYSYSADPSPFNSLSARQGASYVVFGSQGTVASSVGGDALNGSNGFSVKTDGVGMHSGYDVAAAGDFNGDGFADVIIGAPYKFEVYNRAGAAFVVFGSGQGLGANVDVTALDGTDGFKFTAVDNWVARMGSVISSAGDVNGDGLDDLLLDDLGSGNSYVVFGSASGPGADLDAADLDGSNGFGMFTFDSGWSGGMATESAGGGDVNGDGFDDLVLGTNSSGALVLFGSADMSHVTGLDSGYGYSGDTWALNSDYGGDGTHGFHIIGPDGTYDSSGTGRTVAIAGDVNGDGFDDLIIGAPYTTVDGNTHAGAAYVVFGSASGHTQNLSLADLDGVNGFRIDGDTAFGYLGSSVAGAGDINGDGFDDIVIGARGGESEGFYDYETYSYVYGGNVEGRAYVIFGRDFTGAAGEMGTAGDDSLVADGPGAVVRAGSGDDTIEISSTDFFRIDGGGNRPLASFPLDNVTGDKLILSGGVSLDFSSLDANAVQDIEVIDLGAGGNSVAITPRQAAAITGAGNVLQIEGTAGDVTLLAGGTLSEVWGYDVYTYGGVEIRVAAGLTVNLVNAAPEFGGGSTFTVEENTPEVGRIHASDPNGNAVSFSIAGGADGDQFAIDSSGLLRFVEGPDFEARPNDNTYEVRVAISDGSATRTKDVQVTVTDVNEPPTFTGDSAFTVPEGTVTVGVIEVENQEFEEVTYSLSGADAGRFSISAGGNGVLTFTVAPNFESPADAGGNNVYDVTVTATDAAGNATSQDVTVQVTNVNEQPFFFGNPNPVDVPEGNLEVLPLTAFDSDNDPLTFRIVGGSDAGLFEVDSETGVLSFKPENLPDYESPFGADNAYNVRLQVSDPGGLSHEIDLVVNVTDVNIGPPAAGDSYTTEEDAQLVVALQDSLTENDGGGTLTVNTTPVSGPSHGSVLLSADGTFAYTPEANFHGTDSFVYEVSNGDGTSQATATITVTPVNDAPDAEADTYAVSEDGSLSPTVADGLLSNDSDLEGDSLAVSTTPVSGPANGTLSLRADGTFTYTPNADFHGADSFTYEVTDGDKTAQALVTIDVLSVNDAPTSTPIAGDSGQDGAPYSNDVSGHFADDDALTYSLSGAPAGLSIDANGVIGGTLGSSASQGGTNGAYEVTITATDADGASTAQSFTLNVTNPAPIFGAAGYTFNAPEGTAASTSVGSVSATDDDTVSYSITAGNGAGLFAIDGNGVITVTGTIDDDQLGTYSLTVTSTDGQGGATPIGVDVTLTGVNDAPSISFSQPAPLVNGSFETPAIGGGWIGIGPGNPALTGWTVAGGGIDLARGLWVASDGAQSLDMNASAPGSVAQTFDTIPGVEYTVRFDFAGTPGWGPHGLRVAAGGTSADYTFTESAGSNSAGDMKWRAESFTFTATDTSTTLTFSSLTGGPAGPALDNVQVSSSEGFTTDEDVPVVLRGLTVADVDADGNSVRLSLSVGKGELALASTAGLTLVDGDGSDGTLVVTGSLTSINDALGEGLTYTPGDDYHGADTLSVTVDDQGSAGAGGAQSASQSIAIDVDAVTDTFAISSVTSVANGSFETPEVGTWFTTYGIGANLGGWIVGKHSVDVVGIPSWGAPDGDQSVDMNGNDAGRIEQSITTIEDATYRVSFQLWSNGTVQVAAGDESANFTTASNTWSQHSFDFTAEGTSTLLSFESVGNGGPAGPALDDVEVSRVLENFSLGAGGDVLDLSGLLDATGVPEGQAFSGGYLQFDTSSGVDTTVMFDADGGADDYVPVVTLVGTVLTESDTAHYLL